MCWSPCKREKNNWSVNANKWHAARESLELADIRYRKGLVSYIDVIDAQRIVLDAELGVVQTERARLTAMVDLFKAVGGGWEQEQLAQVIHEKP